jgi:hypothetical protein
MRSLTKIWKHRMVENSILLYSVLYVYKIILLFYLYEHQMKNTKS